LKADIPKIDPDRHPDPGASAWYFRDMVLLRIFHDESHGNGKQAKTNLSSKSEGHAHRQWAGSRDKIFSASGQGRTFFLTSLFIELSGSDWSRHASLGQRDLAIETASN
jgi:hypothetical protein